MHCLFLNGYGIHKHRSGVLSKAKQERKFFISMRNGLTNNPSLLIGPVTRCHLDYCVTVCSEKALNSGQIWLSGFSTVYHYTKFGTASVTTLLSPDSTSYRISNKWRCFNNACV